MSNFTTTRQAEVFLQSLADELSISDRRYEQAETSYQSLGSWLLRPASTLRAYNPQVYVQGSFRLGTVIRPISEEEDYDVDAVCELRLSYPGSSRSPASTWPGRLLTRWSR
jgi:hypothetical protein